MPVPMAELHMAGPRDKWSRIGWAARLLSIAPPAAVLLAGWLSPPLYNDARVFVSAEVLLAVLAPFIVLSCFRSKKNVSYAAFWLVIMLFPAVFVIVDALMHDGWEHGYTWNWIESLLIVQLAMQQGLVRAALPKATMVEKLIWLLAAVGSFRVVFDLLFRYGYDYHSRFIYWLGWIKLRNDLGAGMLPLALYQLPLSCLAWAVALVHGIYRWKRLQGARRTLQAVLLFAITALAYLPLIVAANDAGWNDVAAAWVAATPLTLLMLDCGLDLFLPTEP